MASIIDSIRNITEDSWWFPKVLVISAVAFMVYYSSVTNIYDEQTLKVLVIVLICALFGIGSFHINAVINNTFPVLPGLLQIFTVLRNGIITPLLCLPGFIIGYLIYNFILNSFPEQDTSFYFIVGTVVFLMTISFSMLPVILFSVRYNLIDAFNFNIILKSAGNYIVETLSFIIQYVFTILLMWSLLYFIIKNMYGFNDVSYAVLFSFFPVISILIFFSYSANMYGSGILDFDAIKDSGRKKVKKSRRNTP